MCIDTTPTQDFISANMSSGNQKKRRCKAVAERREAFRRDADSEQTKQDKPQETIWHNAGKPTSSVARQTLDVSVDKLMDTIRHNARKRIPSARGFRIPNEAKERLGMP
jgi:hypothetical protein